VRFLWQPAHEAMRTIGRLASWTFGWVVANQIAFFVILALADGSAPGAVSAYTYAYTFFLLPYGVVAVSVMSAVTPSLSARWATRDVAGFRHRMAFGLRGILAVIIPSAVGMLILARPLIDLVLLHGAETNADAETTAATLAMFALGLPGYCTYLYMVRVFQSMQDTRTAFKLYLVENGINVVFGVALVGPLGVRGLALSLSIAYTVAALLAMAVVRQRLGGLGGSDLTTPVKRVLIASAAMAVTTVLAVNVSGADQGVALLGRVVLALVVGSLTYVATAGVLGARQARRTRAERAERSRTGPGRPADGGAETSAGPEQFRGRLDDRPARSPVRRLQPVNDEPGDAAGAGDEHRSEAPEPGAQKEDVDGPDPGGNR
jgi:putative peptidoglycan lipid II flippase